MTKEKFYITPKPIQFISKILEWRVTQKRMDELMVLYLFKRVPDTYANKETLLVALMMICTLRRIL